ncbi:MAG: mechanosensitive ion channel family protein [Actinomycetota bacterium]
MTIQAGVTWAGARDWLGSNGLLILVVLVAAVAVSWLSGVIVRRTRDRLEAASTAIETVSLQRRATVTRLITNAVRVVIWAIAIVLILGQLNVDVGRVLFGAGLASLAIAFGLQPFLHDVVNGIFVAIENQYDVGDLVTLRIEGGTETEGWVKSVTFRSTELELDGGMTETIGHGKIVAARNRSRGRGRLVLDVRLPEDVDAERVREELDRTLREVQQDRRVARTFYTGPQLDRREMDGGEYLTISVETRPDRREQVERALRRTLDRRLRSIDDRIEILEPESEAS